MYMVHLVECTIVLYVENNHFDGRPTGGAWRGRRRGSGGAAAALLLLSTAAAEM